MNDVIINIHARGIFKFDAKIRHKSALIIVLEILAWSLYVVLYTLGHDGFSLMKVLHSKRVTQVFL